MQRISLTTVLIPSFVLCSAPNHLVLPIISPTLRSIFSMTCWFDVLTGGNASSTLYHLWNRMKPDERAHWEPSSILEMRKVEQQLGYRLIPDYILDGKYMIRSASTILTTKGELRHSVVYWTALAKRPQSRFLTSMANYVYCALQ